MAICVLVAVVILEDFHGICRYAVAVCVCVCVCVCVRVCVLSGEQIVAHGPLVSSNPKFHIGRSLLCLLQ